MRILFTGDSTFNIATTGSNATGDGSPGNPWATPQHAIDVLCSSFDFANYTATIQLADGIYSGGVTIVGPLVGQFGARKLILQGNMVSPGNVAINMSSGSAFNVAAAGGLYVQGIIITGNYSYGMYASGGGVILFGDLQFAGNCSGAHRYADTYGIIMALANYSIAGNAGSHYLAVTGGVMEDGTINTTLFGTPAFTTFAASINGMIAISGTTFIGPAAGQKYNTNQFGVINTGGQGINYFPGNTPGSSIGGLYV